MGSAPLASQAFFAISFLVSHLALHSAQEPIQHCPPFNCRNLTNTTNMGCGSIIIECKDNIPHIQFEDGGRSYEVIAVFRNKTIVIRDGELTEHLRQGLCNVLHNFTIPIYPNRSFEVMSPNLTFFICTHDHSASYPAMYDDFHSYPHCIDRLKKLFVRIDSSAPVPEPKSLPHECQVFQFPAREPLPPNDSNWTDLLDAGFLLQWSLPLECLECDKEGIRCLGEPFEGYRCADYEYVEELNLGRKLEIGFGSGAGGILLTCFLFFIYQRRRRSKQLSSSSTLLSQNISSNSTSKRDLENGSTYFGVHIFNYTELKEATNNFEASKELGDGGFGTVYHGKLQDGRSVAVKRLYESNCKRAEQFRNEVEILTRLRHQNLVSLYGCTSCHSCELLLVYEFIPNGTVADHLHGDRAKAGLLTWPIRMSIAIESASALVYLHASDIIHRDVKTNNILLDNNFSVKVADFGLSRLFPTNATHVSTAPQGTPGYVDPQYYQCYQLTDKSDVYSFGVVLIELISSKPAIDISRHQHDINLATMAINKIQNHKLHELVDPCLGFESDYTVRRMMTSVAELAFQCLQQEKEMRPSMVKVLEVLKGIKSEQYKVEKAEEVDIPVDDISMLEDIPPLPMDTVTD